MAQQNKFQKEEHYEVLLFYFLIEKRSGGV